MKIYSRDSFAQTHHYLHCVQYVQKQIYLANSTQTIYYAFSRTKPNLKCAIKRSIKK